MVLLIVTLAIARGGGQHRMMRLGRHKQRLLKTRDGQRHGAFMPQIVQNIIQRPGIALFPTDIDMRITQESVQIPLLVQRGMIGAQPYLREIGKQDFKIDIPGQQAELFTGARMGFPAAKTDVDFTANNRIQRIIIPVTQADQRLRIAW